MDMSELVGKRIRFKLHLLKYEGTLMGVGRKKGTDVIGLLFKDVYAMIGKEISSLMLVHPDDITTTIRYKILIAQAKKVIRKYHCDKSDDIYYPPHQIKVLTASKAVVA